MFLLFGRIPPEANNMPMFSFICSGCQKETKRFINNIDGAEVKCEVCGEKKQCNQAPDAYMIEKDSPREHIGGYAPISFGKNYPPDRKEDK